MQSSKEIRTFFAKISWNQWQHKPPLQFGNCSNPLSRFSRKNFVKTMGLLKSWFDEFFFSFYTLWKIDKEDITVYQKVSKSIVLTIFEVLKLISRKTWATEIFLDFHTVVHRRISLAWVFFWGNSSNQAFVAFFDFTKKKLSNGKSFFFSTLFRQKFRESNFLTFQKDMLNK